MNAIRRTSWSAAVLRSEKLFSLLSLALLLTVSAVHARPHKMRVSDPALAEEMKAKGARVIADYGSFQLLETNDPSPAARKAGSADDADETDFIELNAAQLDTRAPEVVALRKSVAAFGGKKLHLVQFAGPIKPEWRDALEQTGVKVVHYIPQNAYLVHGDSTAVAKMQSWADSADFVQWEGEYANSYKIHPRARATDAKGNAVTPATDTFTIQLVEDADANPVTLALIDQMKLEPVKQQFSALNYLNVIVRITPARLAEISARPDVVSIQPHFQRHRMDERQGQIMAGNLTGTSPTGPGYLSWLASKGFTQAQFVASGFVVDVTDSGIDNGTTNAGHFGLYQNGDPAQGTRVIYNRLEGTANSGSTLQGNDGHGNLNSHIIAGFNAMSTSPHLDSSGFHYGLGICPFVKVGSSVIFDTDNFTSPNYNNLQSRAYRDGARVSNNSWGADTAGAYDVDAQIYDALVRDAQPTGSSVPNTGNQQMVICFAAGNAGPSSSTVGSPGTAKNVIVVGAAENVHSHSTANGGNSANGSDGCSTLDTEANSAADIASFSSRGPCADGRQKPDLVAPGTHVTGGVGQSVLTTNGTGSAISGFKGTGVCALPGGGTAGSANNFFPLGQQFYSTSSGTSHSTPGVVGACALLRQYFINATLTPPSPAMTKAFLVNSARYMTGSSANDNLPSPNQGMGSVNLGTAFDGVTRVLHDQLTVDKFTASGQSRTINGTVVDSGKPFRVTLAWTDAPGPTSGAAYINNLDLTVTIGGNTYKGNVFSGGNSATGGTADSRNNLESVFIPAGVSGPFSVTVTAANIAGDGVPNEAPTLDQDYALVIYNANETPIPVISTDGYALTSEDCSAPNSVVDPSETVTINFALRNIGTAPTDNLVATLLTTNGITSPSGAQTYGALAAGGGSVTQAFSFKASGTCGSNIIATFTITDGSTNLGNVTFIIPLGQQAPVFAENFDGVTAPALPSGWSSTAGGPSSSPWVTLNSSSDTAPNAVFSTAPATIGSNQLVSQTFVILSASSQLTFRHRYGFESSFDGGVLEIKIGAGTFTDIVTAGGSFVSGSYVQTLNSGNPLGARQAWSGTLANFSTVTVNLPVSATGQSVQFRWRSATDISISGQGWWIDSVAIISAVCCGDVFPPILTTQPQSQTVPYGNAAGFSVNAIGQNPLSYQWYLNTNAITDATNDIYSIANATTNDAGSYQVVVTNASGSVTSSVATLTVVVSPLILTNPASLTVSTGSTAGFSVTAIGAAPLSYQWQFGGVDITDATNSFYTRTNSQLVDAGNYTVVVTNFAGSVTSAPALLTVVSGTAANVVISQIYGGGGNSGATYRNDYVELFNPGSVAVNVGGWSVQYASYNGSTWQVVNLSNSIPGGSYYLVQLSSGGASGAILPTPNSTGSVNISATRGKMALVTNQTALAVSNPAGGVSVADFVGYGTANAYEGSGAAPSGGNSTAVFRINNGTTDTDNNIADFVTGTPNPRNAVVTNPPPVSSIDLAVLKSHSGNFAQGDTGRTYTIIVTNVGSLVTTGSVSVVDVLPSNLTATTMTGTGWSITLGTLTATRSDALATNAAYPAITLTVNVATNAPTSVTNLVSVSTGGDTNTVNNTATDITSITSTNTGGGGSYTGVLAGWDVSGQSAFGPSPLLPTTNAPNVTIVGLTRAAGVTTSGSGSAAARAWGGNGFDATTAAAAITANNFVTCRLTASTGYKISFTAIDKYDARRSDSSTTNSIIQYQVGNGGFVTITTNTHPTGGGGFSLGPIGLSNIAALQNIGPGTNVTFRIVPYNTSNAGGNWYLFDVANSTALDFSITGTITPLSGPPAAAPTLTLLSLTNNQFQFTLAGTASSNYVVEISTNLNSGTWSPIHTGAAPILFSEPATNDQRYYRGKIAP